MRLVEVHGLLVLTGHVPEVLHLRVRRQAVEICRNVRADVLDEAEQQASLKEEDEEERRRGKAFECTNEVNKNNKRK